MRIVFIGCVEFSLRALETTIGVGGNVVAVCTLKESSFNADFCDLSNCAIENRIPYCYVTDLNSDETVDWISKFSPDVIFCFGWSRLLNRELLSVPRLGVVGFHPAALPSNRGRHPIIWALALGLKETASTFFFMDQGADTGDILSQVPIQISESDDARTLYDKVIRTALAQIREFVPQLQNRSNQRVKQNHSMANSWRKRSRRDGLIDWRMGATTIHNLVRALTKPYVGAEFEYNKIDYKVWKTEVMRDVSANIEPGKVIAVGENNRPVIKCGDGAIQLIEMDPKIVISEGSYL